MDWPTIRELIAYVFGNVLGMAATVALGRGIWELVTGPVENPLGVVGLLASGVVAYWWLSWVMREYVRPAADRAEVMASDPDLTGDARR